MLALQLPANPGEGTCAGASHKFVVQPPGYVRTVKPLLLASDLTVQQDLKQQITQLFLQAMIVAMADGIG